MADEAEEAVRFQASLLAAAGQAIIAVDLDGRVTYWNEAATKIYGWSASEVMGQRIAPLLQPSNGWGQRGHELRADIAGARPWVDELWMRTKGGRQIPIEATNTPLFDDDGLHVGAIGVSSDITERVEFRKRIDESHRRLLDAQASAHLGSFEVNLDTGSVTKSDELFAIFGVEPESTRELLDVDRIHAEDRARVNAAFDAALAGGPDVEATHRIVRPNGEVRWVVFRTRRFGGPDSPILTGTLLDVTERHEAELALAHRVGHDALTGLPNRISLSEQLHAELVSAGRRGERVAVAFLDLDQFKSINDTLGHPVGDLALRAVAERLRAELRSSDEVIRFGGDEFVLVRTGVDGLAEAEALAIEAAEALGQPLLVRNREFLVTASIGVTVSNDIDTADSLLRDADAAMYQAKYRGRDQIVVFDESARARVRRRATVESELRQARQRGELSLSYQPVVDLATSRVAGFESLIRWDHPRLGSIGPEEFIPIAESNGLIIPIGDWVLDAALRQLAEWHGDDRLPNDLFCSVNLSARQLGQPGLVGRVAAAVETSGVPPSLVRLEITESVLMYRVENAVATLAELRELGAGITIDDFGTGYSSLSYLNRLPITTLKIDRSFVQDIGGAGHETSIIRTIVALAEMLGLDVIAEGVETAHQLEVLRSLGCALGQGYLWSEALRADEAVQWVLDCSTP